MNKNQKLVIIIIIVSFTFYYNQCFSIQLVNTENEIVPNTKVGLSSSLAVSYGLYFSNFTPSLFDFPLMLNTQIDCQTNFQGNYRFDFEIGRHYGHKYKPLRFGLAYGFTKESIISEEYFVDEDWTFLSHKIYSTWYYKKILLQIGIGKAYGSPKYSWEMNGLVCKVYGKIPRIDIGLMGEYNRWYYTSQRFIGLKYVIEASKEISKINMDFSINYQLFDRYGIFGLKALYTFKH